MADGRFSSPGRLAASAGYHGDAEPMEVEEEGCGGWRVQDSGYPDPWGQWGQERHSAFPAPPHSNVPQHWAKMEPGTSVMASLVEPNTEEYVKVTCHFLSSMTFPQTDVTRIFRIQNPFLWQHYILKQQEMQAENERQAVAERHLFHGTRVKNIDAICRKGFDWRVCGRHGTMYGQGCYFARDTRYSHRYSPKSSDPHDLSDLLLSAVASHGQAQGAVCGPSAGSNSGCGPVLSAGTQCHSLSHGSFPATLQRDSYVPSTLQRDGYMPSTVHRDGYIPSTPGFSQPQSKDSFPGASSQHTGGSPHQQGAPLRLPNSSHYMFVARVLVGNAVRGHADYRRPPAVQPGNPLSKQYDCCVDSVADPKIFVVFDSNQTYPEYVVEYSYSGSVT